MFKTGKFYAIQGTDREGDIIFCESSGHSRTHAERLKLIARKASRSSSAYYDEFDDDFDDGLPVKTSTNPFVLKTWPVTSDVKLVIDHMRQVRKGAGVAGIDPNSLAIVIVETNVATYVPESPSDEETELRRFVLEKLSADEKKLLKVEHWDVYNKLADRSMLPDDDED